MTEEQTYFTGENAFSAYGSQIEDDGVESRVIPRGVAKASRTFVNHDTNISVRSDYNYKDYDYFRPSQAIPHRKEEIIAMCMIAYKKVGLVRNVIDLMGDFGAQGIRLQHPNKKIEQFYNTWWEKIGGAERSERFLNSIYRCGQVIIKKSLGSVSSYQERKWRKGMGAKDDEVKVERIKVKSRQIPLKYKFINPLSVEVIADALAQFVGTPALGLKISPKLRTMVSTALQRRDNMSPVVKKMIDKIPKDVLSAIQRGDSILPLDQDKVSIYYYKKDDYELWADPMCYCILDDLLMLNQLKLADRSALDGAISNIRLWKLGIIGDSPANSILPTKTAINKLRAILANNVGGGTMDLVWGPELTFEESNSQVWRWLGSEKYTTTIQAIYEGLGIPSPLRGKSQGTNTSSFIGLNTLIKRLQYGRDALTDFWKNELKYIHKAMGFPGPPPGIIFDFMALADEPAERQLLINLWDRDIISDDTILELFGRLPDVEKARVKGEMKERTYERMPYKASPFHNPDKEHEYRKILLQAGGVAPSEIGIDLQDRKPGEIAMIEKQQELQMEMKKMDIKSRENMNQQNIKKQIQLKKMGSPGRPKNVTETNKRKPKPAEKPSTRAFIDIFMWANSAQKTISDMITSSLLYAYGKKNVRSLSKEEFEEVERIKLNMLCQLEPFEKLVPERIHEALIMSSSNKSISELIQMLQTQFVSQNGKSPNIDQLHQIYASAYALYHE